MTQQEEQLLLIDLCGRLPYGVKVWYKYATWKTPWFCASVNIPDESLWLGRRIDKFDSKIPIIEADEILIKPYLRPMSSMVVEEFKEFKDTWEYLKHRPDVCVPSVASYDWLNAHHFDYRGLIDKGLALEAPEGMYKEEK